jgi:hypothetical protein
VHAVPHSIVERAEGCIQRDDAGSGQAHAAGSWQSRQSHVRAGTLVRARPLNVAGAILVIAVA